MFQISIAEPDGQNGYYTKVPQVIIRNTGQNTRVKFYLKRPNQKQIQGRLDADVESKVLLEGKGNDGIYTLDVWEEDATGQVISSSAVTRRFCVDTGTDKHSIRFGWNEKERLLEIVGSDKGSGVAKIIYQIAGGTAKTIRGDRGFVALPEHSYGKVSAYIVDKAGNQGLRKSYVIGQQQEKPKAEEATPQDTETPHEEVAPQNTEPVVTFSGIENYTVTNREVVVRCLAEQGEALKMFSWKVRWEGPNGESKERLVEDIGEEIGFIEEGYYELELSAETQTGHITEQHLQFIIDRTQPSVRVDDEVEIHDFTSYTCETTSDGYLLVTDAAGNVTKKNLTLLRKSSRHPTQDRRESSVHFGVILICVLFLTVICARLVRRRVKS